MAYATAQDILDLHGERMLRAVADHNRDGSYDPEAVERALVEASGEIDSYLGIRYVTPVEEPVPAILRTAAVEIAIYRLANGTAGLTEDMRKRYEDFVKFLRDVARGNAKIIGAVKLPAGSDPTEAAEVIYPAPSFGRTTR